MFQQCDARCLADGTRDSYNLWRNDPERMVVKSLGKAKDALNPYGRSLKFFKDFLVVRENDPVGVCQLSNLPSPVEELPVPRLFFARLGSGGAPEQSVNLMHIALAGELSEVDVIEGLLSASNLRRWVNDADEVGIYVHASTPIRC